MKNKKKCLSFLLVLMFMLSLIGCSSTSENTDPIVSPKKSEVVNKTITKEVPTQKENTTAVSKAKKTVNGTLKVSYIDVGQADSILIQQGSKSMLIDAGNNEDSNTVKNYIFNQGITKLDYVIGTHPHEDHIGGMDYIINSFKIGKIYMPKATSNTKTFRDVVSAIKAKGLKITAPVVGQTFKIGSATATILAPNSSGYEDLNNFSIVIRVTFGSNSFMFDGDAEDVSENEMLAKGLNVSADVLKVGHHGSSSSTTEAFLNKVNPKYAVISCGKDNSYGHPHKSTMDRLKAEGIKIYRTDENGTIVATSNGKNITFNTKPGSYAFAGIGSSASSNSASSSGSTKVKIVPAIVPKSLNNSKIVYYTPSGKSYHFDKNCSTLRRSKTILTGTLGEALSSSHSDPCNICAGGN